MQRANSATDSNSFLNTVKSCAKFVVAMDIISLTGLTFSKTFMSCFGCKTLPEYVVEKSVHVLTNIYSASLRLIDFAYAHPAIYSLGAIAVAGSFLYIAGKCVCGLRSLKSRNANLSQQKKEVSQNLKKEQKENRDLSAENKDLRKENKDLKDQIKQEKNKAQKEIDDLKEQLEYYVAQTRLYQAIANDINVPVPENEIKRLN